jgi:5-methylcytosine-specific restriction endonuclease McrA
MTRPTPEWLAEHEKYLASDAWAERRAAALLRDKGQCQAQLDGCTGRASQVHHLTYRHWRNEPLFDLASVCTRCHDQITRMDRGDFAMVTQREEEHEAFLRFWKAQTHHD